MNASGPSSTPKQAQSTPSSKDSLSALVAKILDQLSLTSWLPAAVLVAGIAVLFQFRTDKRIDLLQAITKLSTDPFQLLVIMIPILIIATLITQAFSFTAIRFLEGYWSRGWLAASLGPVFSRMQLSKKSRLINKQKKFQLKAFNFARHEMLKIGINHGIVCTLEAKIYGKKPYFDLSEKDAADLHALKWEDFCRPWQVQRLDQLRGALPLFPRQSRILPTALGNRLRATEDTLKNTNGNLEGFVNGRWEIIPIHLRVNHDEFRDRLEMYCTLVFVAVFLCIASIPILLVEEIQLWQTMSMSVGFLALAVVSYSAALTSANAYCSVLKEIDRL